MKPELLVTAGQHTAVNMFPGLVHTARHVMKADNTRSRWANRKEAAVEGGVGDWDEVVTRSPYRKVRLDHLLSREWLTTQSVWPESHIPSQVDRHVRSHHPAGWVRALGRVRAGPLRPS